MDKNRSGRKTMLMSVLMSSPGPIVVGLGLMVGKSSTQLADFIRRSAELLAIIVAFICYELSGREALTEKAKAEIERRSNLFVGGAMVLGGVSMLLISLISKSSAQGNVIPGLSIAVLGVIANTIFWFRYAKLGREQQSSILLVQSRLYRAKSLVDICVTTALLVVLVFPGTRAAMSFDRIGSCIVALYLTYCGIKTIKENRKAP